MFFKKKNKQVSETMYASFLVSGSHSRISDVSLNLEMFTSRKYFKSNVLLHYLVCYILSLDFCTKNYPICFFHTKFSS